MEEWREKGRKLFSRRLYLQAGKFYAVRLDYVNYWNGGYVDLDWEMPQKVQYVSIGFIPERTIIPTAYLFSELAEMPKIVAPSPVAKLVLKADPVRPVVITKKSIPKPIVVSHSPKKPVIRVATKPIADTPAVPVNPFDNLGSKEKQALDNVNFEQSSYVLLPESYSELNQLAEALKRHPCLRIEVSGHTDNIGDPRLNQTLSEYRAKIVATYLIRQGIEESRITARGYGGNQPIVDNNSEANRARNRRVEIRVKNL